MSYEFRFNTNRAKSIPAKRKKSDAEMNYDEIRRMISRIKSQREADVSDDIEFIDDAVSFSDMKILQKKDGQKALTHGKVLNAQKKKYKKWRKHDKKIIDQMLKQNMGELMELGMVKKKKAKKMRKAIAKRILNCFYVKTTSED